MTQGPNPLANSHEGPHLFRYNMAKVFSVFYFDLTSGKHEGWYWEDEGRAHGPFSCSAMAFLDAKAHCPLEYNPRHLPTDIGQTYLYRGTVICWAVWGNTSGPLVIASWMDGNDHTL